MAFDFYKSNFGGKQDKETGKIIRSTPTTTKPPTPSVSQPKQSTSSKSSGGSSKSKSSGSAYDEHVSWFGSADKYASAIKDALNSGKQLSDQAAAAAFQKDNPNLFGGIVPGGGSTPAPNYSSGATGGGATSTGSIGSNSTALIDALKNFGSQFGTASASGQTALNTQANEARNAFIQAGGNIQDIPTNLWGSDPGQGFQTGAGSFTGTPSYGSGLAVGGMPVANAGLTQGPLPTSMAEDVALNLQKGMVVPGFENIDFSQDMPEEWRNAFYGAGGTQKALSELFGKGITPGNVDFNVIKQGVGEYIAQNTQQPVIPEQLDLMQQMQPLLTQYQEMMQQIDAETAPIYAQKFDELMSTINATEAELMQRFEQLGSGVDPATQAALASLKDTVNEQRKFLQEEMSSRGLLQSGIYLNDLNEKINKNELSETQKLLGQRLSDIQNQITNALLSFGNTRIQATSQYGLAAQQAAESAAQRKQEAASNLQNALMKALEMSQKQQSDAANLAWEKEKAMLPYQYPSANTVFSTTTPSADALLRQSQWETEWPWKEKQYQYDLGKPYYKPESGSGGTTKTQKMAAIQQGAVDLVSQLMTKGKQVYMGSSGDAGASGGDKYTYSGPLSSQEAANEAMRIIRSQIGDMGISYDDLKDVEDLVNRFAGIPTANSGYNNAFLQALSNYQ